LPSPSEPSNAAPVRSGLPLFQTNRGLRIVEWNDAAEELTGIPGAEAVGSHCWDVIRGRDANGDLVCHRGCSIARLAHDGWPVRCADLSVHMPSGVERVTVSTIVVGSGDDAFVLHPMQPASDAEPTDLSCPIPQLTGRQHDILELLADGVRAKEIASRLGLSVATVRNHINQLLHRIEARSQLEAVAKARELGLLAPANGRYGRQR
jgi:DNA-binding CsgD family transcriptional regulator